MKKCLFLEHHAERGYLSLFVEAFRSSELSMVGTLLRTIAEPVSRPALMHEYRVTPFSLGVAVAAGISCHDVMSFLWSYVYDFDSEAVLMFVKTCMEQYNLAQIVVDASDVWVQCVTQDLALRLLADATIRSLSAVPLKIVMIPFESVCPKGCSRTSALETSTSSVGVVPTTDITERQGALGGGREDYVARFRLQDRAASKLVAARCMELGVPMTQQYDYDGDQSLRTINLSLAAQTRPRSYQVEAVQSCAANGVLRSGILVLPCGAGKTLVGIMICCAVRKPTLIVCVSSISVEQWKNQILEFANVLPPGPQLQCEGASSACASPSKVRATGAMRIACLTAKQKDEVTEDADFVITTYSMLVVAHKAFARRLASRVALTATVSSADMRSDGVKLTAQSPEERAHDGPLRRDSRERLFQPWGLLLLDEVHVIPADIFRESLSHLDAKGVVGLTATCVREDNKIGDLFHLVGPKLFDVSWESLAARGYLATVTCVEVHVPMTKEFGLEYLMRSREVSARLTSSTPVHAPQRHAPHQRSRGAAGGATLLTLLAAANPNKMLCVLDIVQRHLRDSAKILVFCDHIILLKEYGKLLGAPVICGETAHRERLMIFSDFQGTSKVNVVCVSRVGDVSVNLPSANVVVQVSSHGGSRRQEAQRLGRILRPKGRAANGATVDAWFYSIVSNDTLEFSYASRRTSFLVDQGYTCRLLEYFFDAQGEGVPHGISCAQVLSGHKRERSPLPKSEAAGDVVSMKQEALRANLQQSRRVVRVARHSQELQISSTRWQVELLAKIVASWELVFRAAYPLAVQPAPAGAASARREVRARDHSVPARNLLGSYRTDESSLLEYTDVKREWRQRRRSQSGTVEEPDRGTYDHVAPRAPVMACQGHAATRSLQDFTREDTELVYHEL